MRVKRSRANTSRLCNSLQHTAAHCNTLQHTATHYMTHRVPKDCNDREYGVATISSLPEIICLFCKRALYKRRYSAKETYNFKEPNDRSHPTARRVEKCRANTSGLCNTLQHTATHCNTLHHTHCNTQCNTLQHAAIHCNTWLHILHTKRLQ